MMARFDASRLVVAHRPVALEMFGHTPAFGIEEHRFEQIHGSLGPVEKCLFASHLIPGLHGLEIMHVRIGPAVIKTQAGFIKAAFGVIDQMGIHIGDRAFGPFARFRPLRRAP